MRTYGQHKAVVQDAMNAVNAAKETAIETATNVCLQTICGMFPIGALCREMTISAGDNAWLPDNIAGITAVYDSNDAVVYERGQGAAGADEELQRYYIENVTDAPSAVALPFISTGDIAAGGSNLTCSDLYTLSQIIDITNLTVRIVNSTHGEYYYEIDSVNGDQTIALKGAHPYAETDAEVTVLREVARRINFVDTSEAAVSSGSFTVHYWIYPNPLSQDSDPIPLEYPDALEVMTIRRLPETRKRRPVSKTEIDNAVALAQKKEPVQALPSRPTNQQGTPFKMSKADEDAYSVRGE